MAVVGVVGLHGGGGDDCTAGSGGGAADLVMAALMAVVLMVLVDGRWLGCLWASLCRPSVPFLVFACQASS